MIKYIINTFKMYFKWMKHNIKFFLLIFNTLINIYLKNILNLFNIKETFL